MTEEKAKGKGVVKEFTSNIRNYDYEVVCGAVNTETTYPLKYEIPRENTGTLKDQGNIGACVAEVIAQISEELWKRELEEQEEMSEGFIYGALRPKESTNYGMLPTTAMNLWVSIGTLPKKYLDKLYEMPKMKKLVESIPDLFTLAEKYKISGYVTINYNKQKKDLAIKDALTKYQYGLVAISNDYFREGHCIQLVGWDDEKDTYIYKNSWGANYGDQGFADIPKDEVQNVYLPLLEPLQLPFEDVQPTDWFYKAVKHMVFAGLMNGTSDTTFEPNKPMTRAEVATVMYRIIEKIDERFDIYNQVLTSDTKK